jgi:TonB family protein
MISLLFALKLTLILVLGSAVFALSTRISAAARHLLCVFALAVAVLLPLTAYFAPATSYPAFHFIANASASVTANHPKAFRWLPALWIAGALVVSLRFLLGVLYLAWRTRQSAAFSEPAGSGTVPVRFADVTTPVVWGWLRPTVLMPFSSAQWTPERQRIAIVHEVAHIERADNWTGLLALVARSIYWFHPLVWWLAARLEEQQELACDERVLATGIQRSEYARLLVDTARQVSSYAFLGCAMVPNKGNLRGRIMHILNFENSATSSARNRAAVVSGLALLLLAGVFLPAKAEKTPDKQQTIYKIGGSVTAPKVIYKVEPLYTAEASKAKLQGTVFLNVVIAADGTAKNIQVERSLDPGLDQNAVAAIGMWRFQPATKSGQSVPVHAAIEVNFRLQ